MKTFNEIKELARNAGAAAYINGKKMIPAQSKELMELFPLVSGQYVGKKSKSIILMDEFSKEYFRLHQNNMKKLFPEIYR